MKAIIIDDEPNNIVNLKELLALHCTQVQIIGTACNAKQAKELIEQTSPDLLFLDIQMPDKNGFELLQSLNSYSFEVIFVTAYDKYGIQAIKFAAIDYLLKPINITELKEAVQKAINRNLEKKQNVQLENLISLLEKNQQKEEHRIALPSTKETRFVAVKNIVRCESNNNYTTFHLMDGEKVIVAKPIYEYEEILNSYHFVRCHQSHLVNKKFIKSLVKEDGGFLLLDDGNNIPIARLKKELVKAFLEK